MAERTSSVTAGRSSRAHAWVAGRVAAAAVATAIFVTGCNGNGDDSSERTTTTTIPHLPSTTSNTTTALTTEEAEIVAALDDFWATYREAFEDPEPDDPRLEQFMLDPALSATRTQLGTVRDLGQASRLPDDSVEAHLYEIVAIDGDEAEFRDCWLNDAVVYEVATGNVLDDDVVTLLVEGTVRMDGGTWKVQQFSVTDTREGVVQCGDLL